MSEASRGRGRATFLNLWQSEAWSPSGAMRTAMAPSRRVLCTTLVHRHGDRYAAPHRLPAPPRHMRAARAPGCHGGLKNRPCCFFESSARAAAACSTPITPITPATTWSSKLPTADTLAALRSTFPARSLPGAAAHPAMGTPPYGQLTALGVSQLTQLGAKRQFSNCIQKAGEKARRGARATWRRGCYPTTHDMIQLCRSGGRRVWLPRAKLVAFKHRVLIPPPNDANV